MASLCDGKNSGIELYKFANNAAKYCSGYILFLKHGICFNIE